MLLEGTHEERALAPRSSRAPQGLYSPVSTATSLPPVPPSRCCPREPGPAPVEAFPSPVSRGPRADWKRCEWDVVETRAPGREGRGAGASPRPSGQFGVSARPPCGLRGEGAPVGGRPAAPTLRARAGLSFPGAEGASSPPPPPSSWGASPRPSGSPMACAGLGPSGPAHLPGWGRGRGARGSGTPRSAPAPATPRTALSCRAKAWAPGAGPGREPLPSPPLPPAPPPAPPATPGGAEPRAGPAGSGPPPPLWALEKPKSPTPSRARRAAGQTLLEGLTRPPGPLGPLSPGRGVRRASPQDAPRPPTPGLGAPRPLRSPAPLPPRL